MDVMLCDKAGSFGDILRAFVCLRKLLIINVNRYAQRIEEVNG
jgi:hypothetical protein